MTKVLNGPNASLFCCEVGQFFPVYFSTSFKNINIYLKNCAVETAKSNRVGSKSTFEGFALKDDAWKTDIFAQVISRKQSANQQKQLHNNAKN